MKKLLFVVCLILPVSSFTVNAQSWQLTGFVKQARSFVSQNPDDPVFKQSVTEQKVVISVANENGIAVEGLKSGNFHGYIESCDEIECRFVDRLKVVSFSNNPNFEEQQSGLYVITFRASGTVNLGAVFVKVSRSRTPAEIVNKVNVNTQKAQIILK